MLPEQLTEIVMEGLLLVLVLSLPVIIASMVAGLAISLLGRVFRVNDSGLSPLSRTIAGLVALILAAPWIGDQVVRFSSVVLGMVGQ